MVSLTACGDENVTSPSVESGLSSGESGDTEQINIGGFTYTFPVCNAEREGAVETRYVGLPKYGSNQYFKCEQGSWNMKSKVDIECKQSDVKIGDVCSIDYVEDLSLGAPIYLYCYVYTEESWTHKGSDRWYDPTYASTCEEILNAPKIGTECSGSEDAERTVDNKVYRYSCSSGGMASMGCCTH
ncbi:hypothetical protein B7990_12885 [Fibrobacter sp. UWB4]|nr:hypothetical protein B7990_12885 [Fibrobacter sp. UWB4]